MAIPDVDEQQFREVLRRNLSPARAISDPSHLRGRLKLLKQIDRAFNSPGKHVFIYGDRGVGNHRWRNRSYDPPIVRWLSSRNSMRPVRRLLQTDCRCSAFRPPPKKCHRTSYVRIENRAPDSGAVARGPERFAGRNSPGSSESQRRNCYVEVHCRPPLQRTRCDHRRV